MTVLAPFGSPKKLTNTLKTNKSRKSKNEKLYRKVIKKTEKNASSKEEGDLIILGLPPKKHYV